MKSFITSMSLFLFMAGEAAAVEINGKIETVDAGKGRISEVASTEKSLVIGASR